jgi:ParB family chromosome partitioning protein
MKHRNIAIDLIDANPDQPRKDFDPAALQELADSIRAQGLIQPISVRPIGDRFQIIAGERRYRAHKLLGLATIPALVQSGLTDRDVALQAIIENACRRDVNIMEEADAYGQLVRHGLSNDEIASQVGVAAFRVEWRLSLLNLKPDYQH